RVPPTAPDLASFPTRRSSDLGGLSSQLHQLPGNFRDKPGHLAVLGLSPDHPLLGRRQGQLLHGPGDSHIAEPALLLQLGSVSLRDRKSTRLNSSHVSISYAVF